MKNEQIFKTHSLFESATYDVGSYSWLFQFENSISINCESFWRLLEDQKVKYTSLDNNQKFGLAKPFDLSEILKEDLSDKILNEVKIKENTSDLILSFNNNMEIEILISSGGYESYSFSINGKRYVGMGASEIAIFPI
jgi:hypothetical protein